MQEYNEDDLICVDFDGTITTGEDTYWGEDGDSREQPRPDVVEWVKQQYWNGAHVVVWTARPWSEAATVAARLTEWGVPYHGIRCEKGGADSYIDDKAVHVDDVVE